MSFSMRSNVNTLQTENNSTMNDTAVEIKAYSYQEYRDLIKRLRYEGMATGGSTSEDFLRYTDLNMARMDKWDKRYELSEELKAALDQLKQKEKWVVLSEGWCGDAAHSLPVLAKIAEYSPNIELEIRLRDENLELMDQHLTNGGRSIPKLIRYSENEEIINTWGPRPNAAQQIHLDGKATGRPKAEVTIDLQKWYARDRGETIGRELAELVLGEKSIEPRA